MSSPHSVRGHWPSSSASKSLWRSLLRCLSWLTGAACQVIGNLPRSPNDSQGQTNPILAAPLPTLLARLNSATEPIVGAQSAAPNPCRNGDYRAVGGRSTARRTSSSKPTHCHCRSDGYHRSNECGKHNRHGRACHPGMDLGGPNRGNAVPGAGTRSCEMAFCRGQRNVQKGTCGIVVVRRHSNRDQPADGIGRRREPRTVARH